MRWTDLATWVGPTVNQSGAMAEVRGLVLHTAEGYYNGTISWQKNPDANVSSHFIVSGARDAQYGVADGKLAQMVDTDITAWTQRAGNGHWLSLECSGFGSRGDRLSAGQLEAAAQLLARAHTAYGVPLRVASNPTERGLGHHSMDREGIDPEWGHDDCPGANIIAQKPLIVVRAIEITEGADMLLTDKLSNGWTIDNAMVTLLARTDYLANKLALGGRLDAILAAANDDGDITVTADDATKAELAAIRDALAAVPAQTVAALGAELTG